MPILRRPVIMRKTGRATVVVVTKEDAPPIYFSSGSQGTRMYIAALLVITNNSNQDLARKNRAVTLLTASFSARGFISEGAVGNAFSMGLEPHKDLMGGPLVFSIPDMMIIWKDKKYSFQSYRDNQELLAVAITPPSKETVTDLLRVPDGSSIDYSVRF